VADLDDLNDYTHSPQPLPPVSERDMAKPDFSGVWLNTSTSGWAEFQRADNIPWSLERARRGCLQHCEIKHEGAQMLVVVAGQPSTKLSLGRAVSHTAGDDKSVQWHTSLWEHTAWVTNVRRGSRAGLTTRRYMDGDEMVLTVSLRPGSKARGDLVQEEQQHADLPTVVRRYRKHEQPAEGAAQQPVEARRSLPTEN
jgi:hypothetical protein